MAVLNVLTYPNPILRQKASPVTRFDAAFAALISDMFDTCDAYKGIGLAAPQVGVLQQVLVVAYKKRRFVVVNPRLVSKSGSSWREEGCLSLPTILVDVERAKSVVIEAQDEAGNPIRLQETGLVSTIIQHEMDHLNGVLIIDHGPAKPLEEGA